MGNIRIVDVSCGKLTLLDNMRKLLTFDTYCSNGKTNKVACNTAISLSEIIDIDDISKTDNYIVNLHSKFDNNGSTIKLIVDLDVNNVDINIASSSSDGYFIRLVYVEYKYPYINAKINIKAESDIKDICIYGKTFPSIHGVLGYKHIRELVIEVNEPYDTMEKVEKLKELNDLTIEQITLNTKYIDSYHIHDCIIDKIESYKQIRLFLERSYIGWLYNYSPSCLSVESNTDSTIENSYNVVGNKQLNANIDNLKSIVTYFI